MILGLVVSFSLFALVGSLLLAVLHLPQDFIRWAGLVVLVLVGIGLILPRFEDLLERPFSWIPRRNVGTERGGFLLGIALGAVYVPCAGPVLTAITVAGSTGKIGVETIVLTVTVTFALGASLPLLIFALAIGLVFNVPQLLQKLIPDYTSTLQNTIGNSSQVQDKLNLGGLANDQNKNLDKCHNNTTTLESCGTAPDITGIQQWFNTPGDTGVDLADLKGTVVLVDFWHTPASTASARYRT